jgi:hypothetical protein
MFRNLSAFAVVVGMAHRFGREPLDDEEFLREPAPNGLKALGSDALRGEFPATCSGRGRE